MLKTGFVGHMPENKELYFATLERAAALAGSEQELALLLGVTPGHLAVWLERRSVAPAVDSASIRAHPFQGRTSGGGVIGGEAAARVPV
jgi:hypothetical protein